MDNKLKTWHTQSIKHKIAFYLITRGVAFSYNEADGIVFMATETFVSKMSDSMIMSYGCSLRPIIKEKKQG